MRDRTLIQKIDAFFESKPKPTKEDIAQLRQTIKDSLEKSVSDQDILQSLKSIKKESKHPKVVEFHVDCLIKLMEK